ncbi:MAG TPA: hypothetical protein VE911_03185 [Candidatus Nitrosopolaris sp.]|nr:hypothetical protein [Candidatus Nitrosopolaris sp.]
MLHPSRVLIGVVTVGSVLCVRALAADRLFTLSDDGQTFLYRARPGDQPGAVAEMFGIHPDGVPAFLTFNGISDPTKVGTGFTYRIPNAALRALSQRASALEADNARLTKELHDLKQNVGGITRERDEARAASAEAETRAARLSRIHTLWPILQATIVLLTLVAGALVGVAVAALRRRAQADRYARGLATELDDRRKVSMAERQESARHVLDLENRIRTLEAQLGPRVLVGGRGS